MTHRIMVAIQKGGAAKTVTSVMLAEILAASGHKVLLLDLDSQGNATQMLTQKSIYTYSGNTMLEAIMERDPEKYLLHPKENIDLIPADDMLVTFSRYIYKERIQNPIKTLGNAIKRIESNYDYIIMDCPPNLGDLVLNAIVYSDYIIIPINPDGFGSDALDRFVSNIHDAQDNGHTAAQILGIVFTMRDMRNTLERTIGDNIRERYGDLVFSTEIRRRAKLKEFAFTGTRMERKSEIDTLSDYIDLTTEIVSRIKKGALNNVK